jgi:alpha-1,3-mannosylglycoprotein beta-1,4-N-acetylglucosaminyltransferase A/B
MMYCRSRGTYYVQLEDDILSKPSFITTMKNYASQKTSEKADWIILDFCQLGFIGNYTRLLSLKL